MHRIFGSLIATGLLLSSSVFASEIRVTVKAVERTTSCAFDWLNGWGAVLVSATGSDGQVYQPERDEASILLPGPGAYRFTGTSLGVCGIHEQELLITEATHEVTLSGWCE